MRPLTTKQLSALRLIERGFVSSRVEKSCRSLVQRGLVIDHGRYHATRGHEHRYELADAGKKLLEDVGR